MWLLMCCKRCHFLTTPKDISSKTTFCTTRSRPQWGTLKCANNSCDSHFSWSNLSLQNVAPTFFFFNCMIKSLDWNTVVVALVSGGEWAVPWPQQSGRSSRWSASLHKPSRPSRSHSPSLRSGRQLEGATHTHTHNCSVAVLEQDRVLSTKRNKKLEYITEKMNRGVQKPRNNTTETRFPLPSALVSASITLTGSDEPKVCTS